jgi:hypothetical protein
MNAHLFSPAKDVDVDLGGSQDQFAATVQQRNTL